VTAVVDGILPANDPSLALEFRIEEQTESDEPRTISVSGVWGSRERQVIKLVCDALDGRFYDAESGEFIVL
jgi:hypothetical protein